jgi:large repetitive protein
MTGSGVLARISPWFRSSLVVVFMSLAAQTALGYQLWTYPLTFRQLHSGFSTSEVGIDVGPDGSIYFADSGQHIVGRIFPDGTRVVLAGSPGVAGRQDGTGSSALFWSPIDVAVDAAGNVIVADFTNSVIRKVTPEGVVTTLAGAGFCSELNGQGTSARFCSPSGVVIDGSGNIYVADSGNNKIRKITPGGLVTTLAGWYQGFANGVGTAARFDHPTDLAFDGTNALYVADKQNHQIRKVDLTTAEVTTFAGFAPGKSDGYQASFYRPHSVARLSDGTILVIDDTKCVRRVGTDGVFSTAGGSFDWAGDQDGTGPHARFQSIGRIALESDGSALVTDGTGKIKRGSAAINDAATSPQVVARGAAAQLGVSPFTSNRWQWSIVSRPPGSLAQLSNATASNPTFTPDEVNVYTFRLDADSPTGSSITYVGLTAYCPTPAPLITIVSGANPSCPGTSVTLEAETGFDSYLWSNGATTQSVTVSPSTNTNYRVRGLKNGCWSADRTHAQNVVPEPIPTVYSSGGTSFCYGGRGATFVAYSGEGAATTVWQWGYQTQAGGTFVPIAGATNQTWILDSNLFPAAGSYQVSCRMLSKCGKTIETPLTAVEFWPTPIVTITSSSPAFCEGGSVSLSGNVSSGTTPYRRFTWYRNAEQGVETPSPVLVVTKPGTYLLVVSDQHWCTTASASVNVTMKPKPVATVTASGPTTFCEGGSVTLTAPASASYLWSNGATTQSTTVSASGSYEVTVTNAGGCSATSAPTTVTVNPAPATSIMPSGPTTFCAGGNVTLMANSASSYLWSNGATTQSITVDGSGSYSVTITDANGCSATSAPTTVTVNPTPAATITASEPTTFCQGGSVTLTTSSGASYIWSTGETSQSITVDRSGNYSVTVTGANGCSATSASTTVTMNPLPAAEITASGPTTFCADGTVTLTASSAASYLWSNGATTQSITTSANGHYSVTVTNAGGCSKTSAPVIVTAHPEVTGWLSVYETACLGSERPASAQAIVGGAYVDATYVWSISGGTITQNSGKNIMFRAESDPLMVTVVITDANGCSVTKSKSVFVTSQPVPVITAGGPTTFCEGSYVTLTANEGSPFGSYLWSNGATTQSILVTESGTYSVTASGNECSAMSQNVVVTVLLAPEVTITASGPTAFCEGGSVTLTASGASSYLWSNGATTQSIIVSAAGEYTVVGTNASGCSNNMGMIVTTYPAPAATITPSGPTTFCAGGSVTLTAPSGFTYLWSTGATTQSINATSSGSYSVTVANANGCGTTSSPTTVTVNATPAATISASGPTTFCVGGSVTLTASAGSSYLWSNGATTPSINVTTAGSYGVTVTNASGCSSTSTPTSVVVNAKPATPTITTSGPTTFCAGGSVTLSAPAGFTYLWSTGAISQSIAASAAGSYSVTVTNASGCSASSAAMNVTVNAATSITQQPQSTTVAKNTSAQLSVTATGTGTLTYQWYRGASPSTATPISGATTSTYTTPKLSRGAYTYWVRVTGSCGVANSATATITAQ